MEGQQVPAGNNAKTAAPAGGEPASGQSTPFLSTPTIAGLSSSMAVEWGEYQSPPAPDPNDPEGW